MIDHTDTVAAVKADLLARSKDLSGPCGAFSITQRVAWILKGEGWGLIHSGGNGCETHGDKFRADTLMMRDGTTVDLLIRSESDNGDTSNPANYNIPQWSQTGSQSPDNWRQPFDPGDTPAPIPIPPIPEPGCGCLPELTNIRARIEDVAASLGVLHGKVDTLLARP